MFTPIEQTTLAYQDEHNLTEYDFGEVNGTSQPQLHDTFQMVHVIVRLLEGLLAILGNGATVLAIMKFEYLRTTTNFIICSLAVADILGGLNPLLLLLHSQLTTNFNVWVRLCLVEQSLSLMSSGMNVITIMLISFDRCIYIQYPLRYYSLVKSSQVIVMLVASWVFLIIQVVVLFQTGLKVWPGMTCRAHAFFDGLTYTILVNGQFLFYTIIIIVLYSRIACIAYKQAIAVGNEQVQADQRPQGGQNKITKMMAIVLGAYLICYIPQVIIILATKRPYTGLIIIMERVSTWLWWANSWVNPFIYAWKSKDYRKAFKRLLGMKNEVQPSTSTATT